MRKVVTAPVWELLERAAGGWTLLAAFAPLGIVDGLGNRDDCLVLLHEGKALLPGQPDGQYIVAGSHIVNSGARFFALVRFTSAREAWESLVRRSNGPMYAPLASE